MLAYGTPIKALINEKFGDGIMSMIDCKVKVDRKPDPKGDRVVLTFECVSHTSMRSFTQYIQLLKFCAYNSQREVPPIPAVVERSPGLGCIYSLQ